MIQRQNRKAAESQSIANVNNVMQPSCRRRFLTWQVNRGNRLIMVVSGSKQGTPKNGR